MTDQLLLDDVGRLEEGRAVRVGLDLLHSRALLFVTCGYLCLPTVTCGQLWFNGGYLWPVAVNCGYRWLLVVTCDEWRLITVTHRDVISLVS